MPTLPSQGGSNNTWGTETRTWLLYDHAADGSHPRTPSVSTRIIPTAYMDNAPANGNDDETWKVGFSQMIGSGSQAVPAVIYSTGQSAVTAPVIAQALAWRNQFRAAGIQCLAYIDANNSGPGTWAKTQAAVQGEIDLYESLGYKPDGIWFDNCGQDPANIARLAIYKAYILSNTLRSIKPLMVCNVGIYPDSSYGTTLDSMGGPLIDILSLEGTYANWVAKTGGQIDAPAWALALPKTRFSQIVTGSTLTSDVDTAFSTADARHVGYMYVDTAAGTFNRMPWHWNRQLMYAGGRQQRFTWTARFPSPTSGQTQIGPLIKEPMSLTFWSAYRAGGTSCPVQASRVRAGVTEDFLSTTLATTTNAWVTATDPNGTPFYYHQDLLPGDFIKYTLGTIVGSPTEIIIQVDGTNP